MDLEKFLVQEQSTIAERWLNLVYETYPPQTAALMKKETNQFANPVGYALRHGIERLSGVLHQPLDPGKVQPILDDIVRIRAIQEFAPSQALAFVFLPKEVVRRLVSEAAEKAGKDGGRKPWDGVVSGEQMLAFDSRVDHLALLAFDVYSRCRETLYEVRVGEFKNRTYRLLQRAGLLHELADSKPGPAGE